MARSARRMPIPSRETQQPPTGGQRRRRGAGVSRKKRDLSAAAPFPSQRPTPIHLRTDRRRRCRRFASHTTARVTAKVPVNTRKTQRRARDAQEKTSARPPCDRVELKSSHRCKRRSGARPLIPHLGALGQGRRRQSTDRSAPALSTSQPLAFARSSTSASSSPSSAPLFPTTLAVLSLIAPPLHSLQTPRLRSIDSGARFGPKSTLKRASRLPTRRWSTLPTPGKLDHGVTQGQGRAGSAQGVPRQTPGFTSHNVVHGANDIRERFKFLNCPYG